MQGFDVRLDTGLRLSLGVRAAAQDATLLGAINADDGDRAFEQGLISERLDATTTLDATRGDLGFEIGADGWYDAAYHGATANRSPATFNPVTVANDAFPADTRRLMGGQVELGPAYVRDRFDVGGIPVTVRIGRQTLLWGESLFFAQDGIAGAQAPVDLVKQASQPLVEARELYLPVTQADIRVKLPRGLSLEAYDQIEWRRDRVPAVASYFSTTDILDAGGQRVLAGGGALYRGRDDTPSGAGQFGVALRRDSGTFGLGLYALRYDAKSPQAELGGIPGTYRLAYRSGIDLLGASASTYAGDGTLSGELSYRRNLPLVSRFEPLAPSPLPAGSAVSRCGSGAVRLADRPSIAGPLILRVVVPPRTRVGRGHVAGRGGGNRHPGRAIQSWQPVAGHDAPRPGPADGVHTDLVPGRARPQRLRTTRFGPRDRRQVRGRSRPGCR